MWRYLLLWLPMLAIAVANGALRQLGVVSKDVVHSLRS
jgi:hypothetical protein